MIELLELGVKMFFAAAAAGICLFLLLAFLYAFGTLVF
jgi:hypothetical protein